MIGQTDVGGMRQIDVSWRNDIRQTIRMRDGISYTVLWTILLNTKRAMRIRCALWKSFSEYHKTKDQKEIIGLVVGDFAYLSKSLLLYFVAALPLSHPPASEV
jgi:hypothetical protein